MKPALWLTEKEFAILSKTKKTERETVPMYTLPTEDKWKHFDEAYKKAHNSSHPEDWFQAALLAQQVRNEYFPTRTTYEDPDGVEHEYYERDMSYNNAVMQCIELLEQHIDGSDVKDEKLNEYIIKSTSILREILK